MVRFQKYAFPHNQFPLIERIWSLKNTGNGVFTELVSDGYPEVAFVRKGSLALTNDPATTIKGAYVFGNRDITSSMWMDPQTEVVLIKLKPWALPHIIKDKATILNNHTAELAAFQMHRYIPKDILTDQTISNTELIINHLLKQVEIWHQKIDRSAPLVEESISRLFNRSKSLDFRDKGTLSCSKRYLEKKYKDYIGFSPVAYERIIKIKRASLMMAKGNYNKISDLAYDLGYFDPSHFYKDFKRIMQRNPRLFLKSIPENNLFKSKLYLNQYSYT